MGNNIIIGIIGHGVVGKAVGFGFSPIATVVHNDPRSMDSVDLAELAEESDYIFVSVPTPESKTGEIDISIMRSVLDKLDAYTPEAPVIIKSTVTPDCLVGLEKNNPGLGIVYNPEFLTERTAPYDFINQTRIILGANNMIALGKAQELYKRRFPNTPIYACDLISASMIKYMCNCFFALKVSYMNEWYKILKASGSGESWKHILRMFFSDYRIGNSHMEVPGPDGKFGFGGICFPKDTAAAVEYAKNMGERLRTIEAAREVNVEVRGEQKNERWT